MARVNGSIIGNYLIIYRYIIYYNIHFFNKTQSYISYGYIILFII
jgi:hypothetical protein